MTQVSNVRYNTGLKRVNKTCPNLKIEVTNEENRFNKRTTFVVGVFTSDLPFKKEMIRQKYASKLYFSVYKINIQKSFYY